MTAWEENRFTVTKTLFMEGVLRTLRPTFGKFALKATGLLLIPWALLLMVTLITNGSLLQTLGFLPILALPGLWLWRSLPKSRARQAWKSQEAKYGNAMERITSFYDDHLEISGDGVEKSLFYSQIRDIQYSKHLMLLLCADGTGVLLSKTGFQIHTPAQVADFLLKSKEVSL